MKFSNLLEITHPSLAMDSLHIYVILFEWSTKAGIMNDEACRSRRCSQTTNQKKKKCKCCGDTLFHQEIPYLTGSKNEPVCGLTSVFCVIMLDGHSVHCRARDHNW